MKINGQGKKFKQVVAYQYNSVSFESPIISTMIGDYDTIELEIIDDHIKLQSSLGIIQFKIDQIVIDHTDNSLLIYADNQTYLNLEILDEEE